MYFLTSIFFVLKFKNLHVKYSILSIYWSKRFVNIASHVIDLFILIRKQVKRNLIVCYAELRPLSLWLFFSSSTSSSRLLLLWLRSGDKMSSSFSSLSPNQFDSDSSLYFFVTLIFRSKLNTYIKSTMLTGSNSWFSA